MNDGRTQREDAAALLKEAAKLCEKHNRPEHFNVFTAMFDNIRAEVHLHSRFLFALLRHRKPGEERAANLHDFMGEFAPEPLRDFAPDGAKVKRERCNIDILITNDRGQALVIENKINAGDQPLQLKRYHDKLVGKGYRDIHLLYLTINGRDPSEDSIGDLDEKDYTSISYESILDWLRRCQKRACDEPELRETVAQYSRLVEKLTGQGGSELMNELKELCLRDNNLLIAHNLAKALPYAKASLMHEMWKKIKSVLEENSFSNPVVFSDALGKCPSNISGDRIRKAIEYKSGPQAGWFGLCYSFGHEPAVLCVKAHRDYGYIVGVACKWDTNKDKYDEIKSKLEKKFTGGKSCNLRPWFCILSPNGTGLNPGDIKMLSNKKEREELTDCVAKSAVEKLTAIRDAFATADS